MIVPASVGSAVLLGTSYRRVSFPCAPVRALPRPDDSFPRLSQIQIAFLSLSLSLPLFFFLLFFSFLFFKSGRIWTTSLPLWLPVVVLPPPPLCSGSCFTLLCRVGRTSSCAISATWKVFGYGMFLSFFFFLLLSFPLHPLRFVLSGAGGERLVTGSLYPPGCSVVCHTPLVRSGELTCPVRGVAMEVDRIGAGFSCSYSAVPSLPTSLLL
ncbi:hypothetical protein F5148DRAFT_251463 [Russula earlei]|uniref:Uncharacterized protein n=1 Tax=Russula earlei TaxID=71964 RepID=A0ACC0U472_9AGAM|nr:hypothetical protein F5148DRAFT_251463 [Russula earlei]